MTKKTATIRGSFHLFLIKYLAMKHDNNTEKQYQ